MVYKAEKTLELIETSIAADGGNAFRGWLEKVIPHIGDAYRADDHPFRTHLGASIIGRECAREIWYGWRWTAIPEFSGRVLRLFNRGHLEEARFIAMLLAIGVQVYQQDANGNQFRISDAGGHFGGSGDGLLIGVPDLETGVTALAEFKTSSDKYFKQMQKEGVRKAKFEHYVQMQIYMKKMGYAVSLYMVVNKNDDDLYAELVPYDERIANEFLNRGVNLVWQTTPPNKISESPGWYGCKFCDFKQVCHKNKAPEKTCRSCIFAEPKDDGTWQCGHQGSPQYGVIDKYQQLKACENYERMF